jgi:hypothetical protein
MAKDEEKTAFICGSYYSRQANLSRKMTLPLYGSCSKTVTKGDTPHRSTEPWLDPHFATSWKALGKSLGLSGLRLLFINGSKAEEGSG